MILIALGCVFAFVLHSTEAQAASFPTLSTVTNATNRQIIVDTHNNYRRNVSPTATDMMKMKWSDDAAKLAENWAKQCKMDHSPQDTRVITGFECGENLYFSTSPKDWALAIEKLHSEVKDYIYGVGAKPPNAVIGHYTQVVWHNSYLIGAYVAYCPGAKYPYFYVFNYCPPGNYEGENPYNSGPTCESCPNDCDNGLCTNY